MIGVSDPTTPGDAELIGALRDGFDRADPVPNAVFDAACRLDDLLQDVRIPQLGAFVRELLRDEAVADNAPKEDRP